MLKYNRTQLEVLFSFFLRANIWNFYDRLNHLRCVYFFCFPKEEESANSFLHLPCEHFGMREFNRDCTSTCSKSDRCMPGSSFQSDEKMSSLLWDKSFKSILGTFVICVQDLLKGKCHLCSVSFEFWDKSFKSIIFLYIHNICSSSYCECSQKDGANVTFSPNKAILKIKYIVWSNEKSLDNSSYPSPALNSSKWLCVCVLV